MSDVPTGLMFVDAPPAPQKFNVLLYGAPKSGKSSAAATAPGPILWVNLEGAGALGFARKVAAERGTQVAEVRIAKDDDPRPVLREVVKHVRAGTEPVPGTVVIDTLGKLRDSLIKRIVQPGAKNTLQQFGEVADVLKEMVGALRDLPPHLVLICHEDIDQGEGDEGRIVKPLIGGKVTEHVMGEVDVIAYCGAIQGDDGVRYVGQLVEGRGRRAGDRSGGLGTVRDLDLSDWWQAYQAALTPAPVPWEKPKIDTSDLEPPDDPEPSGDEIDAVEKELIERFGGTRV